MPFKTALLTTLPLLASSAALPSTLSARDAPCGSAYIISARGSYDTSNPPSSVPGATGTAPLGGPGGIAAAVLAQLPGSSAQGVDYPATIGDDYGGSVAAGVQAANALINARIGRCQGNSQLVLMGYSQGAQVMLDAISGGDGAAPPAQAVKNAVKAVVLFGDPTNNPAYTGDDKGTAKPPATGVVGARSGTSEQIVQSYGNVIGSWCDTGDEVCAVNTPGDPNVHTSYFPRYNDEATRFVLSKFGK